MSSAGRSSSSGVDEGGEIGEEFSGGPREVVAIGETWMGDSERRSFVGVVD